MKIKICLLLSVLAVLTIVHLVNNRKSASLDSLTFENIDAMASGEIIIGPFCRQTATVPCVGYENGLFLVGVRQYF